DLGVQPASVPPLAPGLPDRERHAQRAGHPQQRRAPHGQPDDRVDELVHGGEVEDGELMREGRLVNGDDVRAPPADNVVPQVVDHTAGASRGPVMLTPRARAAIVTACQELSRAGLVVGTAGNVSVREGDLVAVTPSGVRYAELTPELVGVHR